MICSENDVRYAEKKSGCIKLYIHSLKLVSPTLAPAND